jgi:hypothetical protein
VSTGTVRVVEALAVSRFLVLPNPFATDAVFTYEGAGIASTFRIAVYDLAGHVVWTADVQNATEIVWNGTSNEGEELANGAYIYVAAAADGTHTFTGKGKVFINRQG